METAGKTNLYIALASPRGDMVILGIFSTQSSAEKCVREAQVSQRLYEDYTDFAIYEAPLNQAANMKEHAYWGNFGAGLKPCAKTNEIEVRSGFPGTDNSRHISFIDAEKVN